MNDRTSGLAHFSFCVVFAAALSACGGGSGGSAGAAAAMAASSASTAALASDDAASGPTMSALGVKAVGEGSDLLATEGNNFTITGTQVVQYGAGTGWISKTVSGTVACSNDFFGSDPNYGVVKGCKLATPPTSVLASEGAAFTVSGTQVVQYGAGSTWLTKSVTGSGSCSNDFFGTDPAPNVVKSCQLASATVTTLAAEGAAFTVPGTQVVQYGANDKWLTKGVTGKAVCSNDFFGADPVPNVAKSCQLATTVTAAMPLSAEGKTFSVSGTQLVQYGAGTGWIAKSVTGTGTCSNTFFGSDPMPNVVKSCQLAAAAPAFAGIVATAPLITVAAVTSLMPIIDMTKLPAPAVGYATERIKDAFVADPSQTPVPSDSGDFREVCDFSHMSYDDPIVSPGAPGMHLHTFFGNTGTSSKSTVQSIATTGNSTCAGGIANRSAYWMPSVIDTKDGTPMKPIGSIIYYKQGYNYIPAASIKPLPAGLRMVAGNSASSGEQGTLTASITCFKPDGTWVQGQAMPAKCPAGSTLNITVSFPQCWDGVNLDSPDHKSHMTYSLIGCPSTHPVPLPHITIGVNYNVVEADSTSRWRLSSDNYASSLPGGYSSHADWFGGWNRDVLNTWTTRCVNASMDCHAYLIGDGRTLY